MTRPAAFITLLATLLALSFSTWQFFLGNFGAGLLPLPMLLIIYFFVLPRKPGG